MNMGCDEVWLQTSQGSINKFTEEKNSNDRVKYILADVSGHTEVLNKND